jgi:hypothetical protein
MYQNDPLVINKLLPDVFTSLFDTKIKQLINEISICDNVYNGNKVVTSNKKMLMTRADIRECILKRKTNNSEGFESIPQRILLDVMEILFNITKNSCVQK